VSLDLGVVTKASASDVQTAVDAMYEQGGAPDGALRAFADDVSSAYEGRWPWTGSPIVSASGVLLLVVPESWDDVVPEIVKIAHRHGLVAVDPQSDEIFPPGTPYDT
jgi:hypothetical protein